MAEDGKNPDTKGLQCNHKQEKKSAKRKKISTLHTQIYTKGGTSDLFIVICVHPGIDVGRGGTFDNSRPVNTANKLMQEVLSETIKLFLKLYRVFFSHCKEQLAVARHVLLSSRFSHHLCRYVLFIQDSPCAGKQQAPCMSKDYLWQGSQKRGLILQLSPGRNLSFLNC